MDGKPVADGAGRLQKEWGGRVALIPVDEVKELETELGGGDAATGKRWVTIAEAMAAGDYRALLELLIEQNRVVMEARGSASWIEVSDARFHVRFHAGFHGGGSRCG